MLVVLVALVGCGKKNSGSSSGGGTSFAKLYDAAMKEPNADQRARQLMSLAYDQHKGKDSAGAKQSLKEAEKSAKEVTAPIERAALFTQLASTQARTGKRVDARDSLGVAAAAAGEIEDVEAQAAALCEIGEAYGYRLEDATQASATLLKAGALAEKVSDPQGKVAVHASIAKAFGRAGDDAAAKTAIDAALAQARAIEDPIKQSDAIVTVAKVLVAVKKKDEAVATLQEAVETATKIENKYGKALAMADIAEQLSRAGDAAAAHQLLDQADHVANDVPEPDLQRQAMERVRTLMGKLPK
jgi:tetratricopeptide (TPR) repeat protein